MMKFKEFKTMTDDKMYVYFEHELAKNENGNYIFANGEEPSKNCGCFDEYDVVSFDAASSFTGTYIRVILAEAKVNG